MLLSQAQLGVTKSLWKTVRNKCSTRFHQAQMLVWGPDSWTSTAASTFTPSGWLLTSSTQQQATARCLWCCCKQPCLSQWNQWCRISSLAHLVLSCLSAVTHIQKGGGFLFAFTLRVSSCSRSVWLTVFYKQIVYWNHFVHCWNAKRHFLLQNLRRQMRYNSAQQDL